MKKIAEANSGLMQISVSDSSFGDADEELYNDDNDSDVSNFFFRTACY